MSIKVPNNSCINEERKPWIDLFFHDNNNDNDNKKRIKRNLSSSLLLHNHPIIYNSNKLRINKYGNLKQVSFSGFDEIVGLK